MSDLTFDEYQDRTADTAIYPEAGTGGIMALAYVGLGLGEAGEVQGKLKKVIRDSDGILTDDARKELLKEVGDLQYYVARMATELGVSLGELAQVNVDKLADRKARGVIKGSGDNR